MINSNRWSSWCSKIAHNFLIRVRFFFKLLKSHRITSYNQFENVIIEIVQIQSYTICHYSSSQKVMSNHGQGNKYQNFLLILVFSTTFGAANFKKKQQHLICLTVQVYDHYHFWMHVISRGVKKSWGLIFNHTCKFNIKKLACLVA